MCVILKCPACIIVTVCSYHYQLPSHCTCVASYFASRPELVYYASIILRRIGQKFSENKCWNHRMLTSIIIELLGTKCNEIVM